MLKKHFKKTVKTSSRGDFNQKLESLKEDYKNEIIKMKEDFEKKVSDICQEYDIDSNHLTKQ